MNRAQMKMTRSLVLAAMLCLPMFLAGQAVAEDSAPPPVAGLFDELRQLQDANLGIARTISETEQRAAAELRDAIASGSITDPAHQAIARTFIANALTLASVMLSPIQTRQAAPADSVIVLIQRNIALVHSIAAYAAQDRKLSAAIARYTVLQMQTQDLAFALQNGWKRYGTMLQQAASSGILAANAFNPQTQSWGLDVPVVNPARTAEPARPVAAPQPQPAPLPEPAPIAEAAPVPPAAPVPEPRLTGQPRPSDNGDLAAAVVPLEVPPLADAPPPATPQPQPAPQLPPAADIPERLAASGPLDVDTASLQPGSIGDWTLSLDADGRPSVTARNLDGNTASIIRALTIGCAPDGTVEYVVDSAEQFSGFRVYSDRSQYRTVAAQQNVVRGDEARAMSETLKLGYDWAQQVPDAGRRLTLRANDGTGTQALFATSGYPESRDRIATACAPGTGAAAAPAMAPASGAAADAAPMVPGGIGREPQAAEPSPMVVAPAEPEPAAPAAVEAIAPPIAQAAVPPPAAEPAPPTPTPPPVRQPRRETTAPIPAPRLERPVDIMNGG